MVQSLCSVICKAQISILNIAQVSEADMLLINARLRKIDDFMLLIVLLERLPYGNGSQTKCTLGILYRPTKDC